MSQKQQIEEACDILVSAEWSRADNRGRRNIRMTEEGGDAFGFMMGMDQKKRFVHPKNDFRRATVSRGFVRFFTQKSGIILEDETVPIEDIDRITEKANEGR